MTYEFIKENDKDHVATPRWVVEQIYEIINISNFKNIWFPFNNYDSEFKLKAKELNLQYKATHLFDDLGNDFFMTDPPNECELMISNPPFSNQNSIIEHSFKLIDDKKIKSFALLLPLRTLETPSRSFFWTKYNENIKFLIFSKRIKFIGGKSSFNQGCVWVLYNINTTRNLKIELI